MNSVVEKLAAIEKEVAAIQPKMVPLTQRIADLDQKVAGFARQLTGIAEESAAVKQDIELTQQSLTRIQTLIGESRVESEQLVAGQEENLQRCETMTAVFGAAFQAMSQFFETAQRMGLADQAKAVFLPPASEAALGQPVLSGALPSSQVPPALPVAEELPTDWKAVSQEMESAMDSPAVADPAITDTAVTETLAAEPVISEPPVTASPEPLPTASPEPPPESEPVSESAAESALSESDFDSAMSGADSGEPVSWSVPGLPDVAAVPEVALPEMEGTDLEASPMEPPEEIVSQLEVSPLNLSVPALPEQNEPIQIDENDEQEIEAMLANMMAPVTATAGG